MGFKLGDYGARSWVQGLGLYTEGLGL